MVKKGIAKLPISVRKTAALQTLEVLSRVNHKIGRLEERFKHSIVN